MDESLSQVGRNGTEGERYRASGKKLDDTYKLAWIRGLKTTYYLRAMGATHAEKSTTKTGELNAVSSAGAEASTVEPKFCAIDKPDCEACQ